MNTSPRASTEQTRQTSRKEPYFAHLKERYVLNLKGSAKDTQHIVLDIRGSNIKYEVGDCLAVLPTNAQSLVNQTLKALNCSGEERITLKDGDSMSLRDYLRQEANVSKIDRAFVQALSQDHPQLQSLLNDQELDTKLSAYELWDFINDYKLCNFDPLALCQRLKPISPRFYSIASSQNFVGDEIHLTVANVRYESNGKVRYGLATHFLCDETSLDQKIPIYIHPSRHFRLPQDSHRDMIMVGPGTGIAPFRAFLQEREFAQAKGRNWLFFGDQHEASDFLYRDELRALEAKGFLRLDLAFSRDQAEKIYVQDRMMEHATDLWQWLEGGAVFYVCGDAKSMAKSVDAALHQIIAQQGKMDAQAAQDYVKLLKTEKRYLRDVY